MTLRSNQWLSGAGAKPVTRNNRAVCRGRTHRPRRPQAILAFAQDYAHPSGTTRMGTERSSSVVGADLVCHHVPNLSVVSASCFPSTGSANPTLTVMLLAWRAACAISLALQSPAGAAQGQAASVSGAIHG
jgi:choline dehydrogenase-like flavoprotein